MRLFLLVFEILKQSWYLILFLLKTKLSKLKTNTDENDKDYKK
jgi:hypothetical protein